MKRFTDNHKWWVIIGTALVIVAIGTGIFFYHNFFRQTNAKLIETVPPEVSFIFQINDNETFVKKSSSLLPYLNELFAMDAVAGFEYFVDKFPTKNPKIIISGHQTADKTVLLFSTKIDERTFRELLSTLRIDPRNYISFEDAKIYTFGTHFKRFNFTYQNNIFSASEEIELLKKSMVQLRHPRNLLSNKDFMHLYKMVEKNEKQNWLILNSRQYFANIPDKLASQYKQNFNIDKSLSSWSAFQIHLSDNELKLTGFSLDDGTFFQKFDEQPAAKGTPSFLMPLNCNYYISFRVPDKNQFIKQYSENNSAASSTAINQYKALNPLATYYFSLTDDSIAYHYLIAKVDTNSIKTEALLGANQTPDSIIYYSKNSIYKSNLTDFNDLLSSFHHKASLRYFIKQEEYYIFSDSPVSLEYYLKSLATGTIDNNQQFKFSKSGLPTESNYELFFYSEKPETISQYFIESETTSNVVKGLFVFSLSFSAPQDGLVPTYVYIKFR